MYKNFTLTESEREEILNRHKDHGYRQPLNEQVKQPTGDFTTIGRFGTSDAKHFEKRGFTVKGGVAILKHPNPKLVITVKPSQKGWAAYQGGVLKFDLPHDDCDVELDKLIRINSLQGGNKIGINEQISNPDDFGVKGMVKQVNKNTQQSKLLPDVSSSFIIDKDKVAEVIDSVNHVMTTNMFRNADDMMSIYKMLLPLKGKNVYPPGTELYAEMSAEEQSPMPALKYFNMMYTRIKHNEYGMGGMNFIWHLNHVGDKTAGGDDEYTSDKKYTTPKIKNMIYLLIVDDAKRKVEPIAVSGQ